MHLLNVIIHLKYQLFINFRYYWKGDIQDATEILLVCCYIYSNFRFIIQIKYFNFLNMLIKVKVYAKVLYHVLYTTVSYNGYAILKMLPILNL